MRFKKNHIFIVPIKIFLTALLLTTALLSALAPSSEAGPRIAVLITSTDSSFQEGLAGFQQYLAGQHVAAEYEIYPISHKAARTDTAKAMDRIKQGGFHAVLTLGSGGAEAMARSALDVPHIACMVLRRARACSRCAPQLVQ